MRISQYYYIIKFVNFKRNFSAGFKKAAAPVGLSPVYLCARFKDEVGKGYSGPRYLSRVFQTLEGMNPTQYRAFLSKNRTTARVKTPGRSFAFAIIQLGFRFHP